MQIGIFSVSDVTTDPTTGRTPSEHERIKAAVAIAKKVAESMDSYMKSLPADTAPDPYADIPVFSTPTSDVLAKQGV